MNQYTGHQMRDAVINENAAKMFWTEFKSEPTEVEARRVAKLNFKVKNRVGKTIRDLQIVHEKPMHLLMVSRDLAEFYHVHPEPQADGSYNVEHTFPNGGDYLLYADFTPPGSGQVVEPIELKVKGAGREAINLAPDEKFEKKVDGLRVRMKPRAEIKAGHGLMIDFQVFDAVTDQPVTDLQNYLGELAHFVIISEDLKDFVHAHPMSKAAPNSMNGMHGHHHRHHQPAADPASRSEVMVHTAFPRVGLYKIWAQFQRGGRIITAAFVVNVNF